MRRCGSVSVAEGISIVRRSQISGVFHSVPTRAKNVVGAPNPLVPVVQLESSNSGPNQVSAGAVVVYRQVCGVRSDAATTCRIDGDGSYMRRIAATVSGAIFVMARSYVITPLTSTSTSVVWV